MTPFLRSSSLGAALLSVAAAAPALATDPVVASPGMLTTAPVESAGTLPNRFLLSSGMFTLGAAYVPALVVAIESEHPEDKHLYAPIVGPWFDLADREDCTGECSGETLDEALLVTDGVFQGLGVLQIIGAFVLPEAPAVAVRTPDGSPALAFTVSPANFGRGANGLLALGHF